MNAPLPASCPGCRQADQVQPVAAVVAAGWGPLSWDLAAPQPPGRRAGPRPRRRWPWWRWALMALGLVSVPLDLALLALLVAAAAALAVLVALVAGAVAAAWGIHRVLDRQARADRREAAAHRYRHAAWYWQQLHYCHRCGGVFLPGHPWQHPAVTAPGSLAHPAHAWALAQRLADHADDFHARRALPSPR